MVEVLDPIQTSSVNQGMESASSTLRKGDKKSGVLRSCKHLVCLHLKRGWPNLSFLRTKSMKLKLLPAGEEGAKDPVYNTFFLLFSLYPLILEFDRKSVK